MEHVRRARRLRLSSGSVLWAEGGNAGLSDWLQTSGPSAAVLGWRPLLWKLADGFFVSRLPSARLHCPRTPPRLSRRRVCVVRLMSPFRKPSEPRNMKYSGLNCLSGLQRNTDSGDVWAAALADSTFISEPSYQEGVFLYLRPPKGRWRPPPGSTGHSFVPFPLEPASADGFCGGP